VRFRTLGCYPLTGAVESRADTLPEIIQEMLTRTSERQGRAIDHDQSGPWRRRSRKAISDERADLDATAERPIAEDIDAYLKQQERKDLLRFITCGSVDDGKSTLIGRLLYDTKMIFEDQLGRAGGAIPESLRHGRGLDSPCWSTVCRPSASRASPSTSPTAFRHAKSASSSSPTRRATSSTPATWRPAPRPPILAVILVDARKGVLTRPGARLHRLAAGHPPRGAGGQQDGPGRRMPWYDGSGAGREFWRRPRSGPARPPGSGCRCSASRAPAKAFAATRARLPAARSSPATASWCCPRASRPT
jgi:hypothetical protein